jgi:hypothetical protein
VDPRLAVRHAVLACAPERAIHARWLQEALTHYNIGADIVCLGDAYDLPRLRQDLGAIAARSPGGIVANITGGSKLMTLAAWEIWSRPADRVYYVDIRGDRIQWLRPEAPSQPIADRICLEPYLVAHGLRIPPRSRLLREPPPAAELSRARNRACLLAARRTASRGGSEGGAWLEELVFAEIVALASQDPTIHDFAHQFVIDDGRDHDRRIENEIDVAVLRDNTLFLVECKTGMVGKGAAAVAALFKLGQLRASLGGLRGRGVFVTTEVLSGPVRERAGQLGIAVIERRQLAGLRDALADILGIGR